LFGIAFVLKLKKYNMKKYILLSTVLFISATMLFAQTVNSISEQEFTFSSGQKEVVKIMFKDVNAANLEMAIVDYFKKNYKAKVSGIKKTEKEFIVSNFKATDIQQKMTSAVFKVQELDGNAIFYIHYKSDGYVVSSKNTPDIYPSYKSMTEKIGALAVAYSYNDVIELRKKDLALQENALSGFIKSENKQSDAIDKSTNEIKSSETAIKGLESDLAAQKVIVLEKVKLVEDKKVEMSTVNVKSLEKSIKEVESDSKKATKEIEGVIKDIASKNAEIAKLHSEIVTLDSSIEPINTRISSNTSKIEDVNKQIAEFNEDALKDQLKMLEKDSKTAVSHESKFAKSIDKEKASIEKNNAKIKDAQTEIFTLKAAEASKQIEIDKTNDLLKALQYKVMKLK
jgi:hypothetical protein